LFCHHHHEMLGWKKSFLLWKCNVESHKSFLKAPYCALFLHSISYTQNRMAEESNEAISFPRHNRFEEAFHHKRHFLSLVSFHFFCVLPPFPLFKVFRVEFHWNLKKFSFIKSSLSYIQNNLRKMWFYVRFDFLKISHIYWNENTPTLTKGLIIIF